VGGRGEGGRVKTPNGEKSDQFFYYPLSDVNSRERAAILVSQISASGGAHRLRALRVHPVRQEAQGASRKSAAATSSLEPMPVCGGGDAARSDGDGHMAGAGRGAHV